MTNHANRRSAMAYVTLTTGGTVITRRSDVDQGILDHIARALAAKREIGGDWTVDAGQSSGGFRFIMRWRDTSLARCWLCTKAAESEPWWEEAEAEAPEDVVLARPRGAPWLATSLQLTQISTISDPAAIMMQLADATRCVAWALYDQRCP